MTPISVALITKNEAHLLRQCLKSVAFADEIVVLDGLSSDETVTICQELGAKVFQKKFESFPIERDYILQQTTHDWVLSIDTDMVFPKELTQEIQQAVNNPQGNVAFYMKGLTIFLGQEVRHCGWFDCRYLRLFNKRHGHYDKNYSVLDVFQIKGSTGKLDNHFLHYGGDDFAEYFGKIKRYSYLTALEYEHKGVQFAWYNIWFYLSLKPFLIFFV